LKYNGEGKNLKSKLDFYIAFYEQLARKGFQAYVPHSYNKENHIADICLKGRNIAHLTKADTIVKNPYANTDDDMIDTLRRIAKKTALDCGVCSEKPYDETVHQRLPDGAYKIAEFNGTVLAGKHHPLLEYVFYISKQPPGGAEPEYYYNKADAMQNFAFKSGLVDERQFFSENELSEIHGNLVKMRLMRDNDLTLDESVGIDKLTYKIEGVMPELGSYDIYVSFKNELAYGDEGVEP